MILRYLREGERSRVQTVFEEFGCQPPDNGKILVNEHRGEIVSLQCYHLVPHAGPVWVAPVWRGQGLWPRMQQRLEADLPKGSYFYQFGTERNQPRLRELGLQPLGWTVWGKRT